MVLMVLAVPLYVAYLEMALMHRKKAWVLLMVLVQSFNFL